jgi:hypothetical protein
MRRLIVSLLVTLAAIVTASPARAEPAFTLDLATVSAGMRYGSENLNFGVGARGGYTLSQSIYIGGVFDYWFGESEEQTVPGAGTISAKVSAWDLMGEVGYDLGVSPTVVIRPFGGVGVFHADGEVCAPTIGCMEASDSEAGGAFGGQFLFRLEEGFHLGAEVRILIVDETAFMFGGNVGTEF